MYGQPEGRSASIRLLEDDVTVWAGSLVAALDWPSAAWGWSVQAWAYRTSPGSGVALHGTGSCAERLTGLQSSLTAPGYTGDQMLPLTSDAHVPLYTAAGDREVVSKERATFAALCTLLAQRPALRGRLGDPGGVSELLRCMAEAPMWPLEHVGGLRPRTVEVTSAMETARLTHPLGGRPVPGDPVVEREEAVDRVLELLATGRYGARAGAERDAVGRLLDREYYAAEPWPFGSLTA